MEIRLVPRTRGLDEFEYSIVSGRFYCRGLRIDPWSDNHGHLHLRAGGKDHRAHRLAWFLVTGEWPVEVDHINRIPAHNMWINLREVSHKQNMENLGVRSDNRSGVRGVGLHKATGLWRARVTIDGKQITVGYFKTIEEATEARIKAAKLAYTHSDENS